MAKSVNLMRTTMTITIRVESTSMNYLIWFLEPPHRHVLLQPQARLEIISHHRFQFNMKMMFPALTDNRQAHFTGQCIYPQIPPSQLVTHKLAATNTRPVCLRVVIGQILYLVALESLPL